MKRQLKTFQDVEEALRPYVPLVKKLTGTDTVLNRIIPLMTFLGNPENKLKTIHIAGTSGKTSTAYFVASLLKQTGLSIGLTVSPHIDKISERTQINGLPLDEVAFSAQMSEFLELVDTSGIKPSYFELIYAFSIWLFAKLNVDYAVIETGLGGLYDATNVVTREDKICVITDIGFDHMSILGNTLAEITAQKVGIVHAHNPLIMYKQNDEIMSVVKSWVNDHKAKLYLADYQTELKEYGSGKAFEQLADYQKRNWLLAYKVYRFTAERDSLKSLTESELTKSQQTIVPARMDESKVDGHLLVMDGAHNYQKMTAFISSYKHKFPDSKPAFLIAFKSDKAYIETLPEINDLASEIILSTFNSSQDLPVVSSPPEDIAKELQKLGSKNITIEPDNRRAYQMLLKSKAHNLIITGSFYLIAQIRQGINK
jgi:dihydrofolate synthase/folylpolyglutamate synthase